MELELTFIAPRKGKLPIARDDSGKIHLLDHTLKESYSVEPGETWLCETLISNAKSSVVKPLKRINSKTYNSLAMKSMMSDLKQKYHGDNSE